MSLADWTIGGLAAIFCVERCTKVSANLAHLENAKAYFKALEDGRKPEDIPVPPPVPEDKLEEFTLTVASKLKAGVGRLLPFELVRKQKAEKKAKETS